MRIALHFARQRVPAVAMAAVLLFTAGCGFLSYSGEVAEALKPPVYTVLPGRVLWAGKVVPGADAGSFKAGHSQYGHPLPWGRDKYQAYYRNHPIPGSHGPSFEAINDRWARDQSHVYLGTQGHSGKKLGWRVAAGGKVERLEGADPKSFRLLETPVHSNYVADDNHVYYQRKRIEHADPATFRKVDRSPLWRDDRFLYYLDKRIETTVGGQLVGADADRLKPIEGTDYATDGVGVWVKSGNTYFPVPEAEPATFEGLDYGFCKDARHVWHCRKLVPGVDAASFQLDGEGGARDRHGPLGKRDPRFIRDTSWSGAIAKQIAEQRKKREPAAEQGR